VCMEMVAQKPDLVLSVALVHSHVFADPAEKKEARNATIRDIEENGREAFLQKFIPGLFGQPDSHKEIADRLITRAMTYDDSAWIHGTAALRDRNDHSETLKNISVPVLMLMGAADTAVKPELATKQAPMSGHVTMHMYPGIGHLGMYENTARMIEDLIRFYATFA
jgi:pimeloyl-ACP methyl ester carboxylesterase